MALTKEKIIDNIYHQVGLSKSQSRIAAEGLLEIIKETLENGEDLLISGFGKFLVKEKSVNLNRFHSSAIVLLILIYLKVQGEEFMPLGLKFLRMDPKPSFVVGELFSKRGLRK